MSVNELVRCASRRRLTLVGRLGCSRLLLVAVVWFCLLAVTGCSLPFAREALLHVDGDDRLVRTKADTVGGLLDEAGIILGESDRVTPSRDTPVVQGMRIVVVRRSEETRVQAEPLPPAREEVALTDLPQGLVAWVEPGFTGEQEVTYQIVREDGLETMRQVVASRIVTPARSIRVGIGAQPRPDLDAFQAAASLVLSQPGASRLPPQQIEESLRELARQKGGSQFRVLHVSAPRPITFVSFAASKADPVLIVYWWGDGATAMSQRLVASASPLDARVEAVGDRWELGLTYTRAGVEAPTQHFALFALNPEGWLPLWSSERAAAWRSSYGTVTFSGNELARLVVVGQQTSSGGTAVFSECAGCAHREVKTVWERSGNAYWPVETYELGSPYRALYAFLERLRSGDELAAAELCVDPGLVQLAGSLGLDDATATWTTANRANDTQLDFAGPPGRFRARLVAHGRAWRIASVERTSAAGSILYREPLRTSVRREVLTDPDAGNPTYLAEGMHFAWSPDYRQIAYDADSRVCVLNADGTGLSCPLAGSQPKWSPQGDRLLFVREAPGGPVIWLANRDGTGARPLGSGSQPTWSPDARQVAFSYKPGGADWPSVFIVRPDGGGPAIFASDGDYPSWSPDGSRLAFITRNGDLVVVELASGHIQILGSADSFRWSPAGTRMAVLRQGQLELVDVAGLTRPLGEWRDVRSVAWSPDGLRLAVGRANDEIWLVGADGAANRKLVDGAEPVWAWTP